MITFICFLFLSFLKRCSKQGEKIDYFQRKNHGVLFKLYYVFNDGSFKHTHTHIYKEQNSVNGEIAHASMKQDKLLSAAVFGNGSRFSNTRQN